MRGYSRATTAAAVSASPASRAEKKDGHRLGSLRLSIASIVEFNISDMNERGYERREHTRHIVADDSWYREI
jgi:hypothetical protein